MFCFSDNPGHMIKIIAAMPNFKEYYPLEPNARHRNMGAPVLLSWSNDKVIYQMLRSPTGMQLRYIRFNTSRSMFIRDRPAE